jgi:hypothetical protein
MQIGQEVSFTYNFNELKSCSIKGWVYMIGAKHVFLVLMQDLKIGAIDLKEGMAHRFDLSNITELEILNK